MGAWMAGLDWLTARPIAHRGLHDTGAGIIENTPSAVEAAIAGNYGIEVDIQLAGDGEAMVFHDDTLDRLTTASGPLAACTAAELGSIAFRATADRMQTLAALLDQVAGRTPLVVEVKSRWDDVGPLERRVAGLLAAYRGPVAVMSFDTRSVAALREIAPALVRGVVAERFDDPAEWPMLSPGRRFAMRHLLPGFVCRPHFINYHVKALPAIAPFLARSAGLPLLAWTVRSEADRKTAARWADAMVFEGFRP